MTVVRSVGSFVTVASVLAVAGCATVSPSQAKLEVALAFNVDAQRLELTITNTTTRRARFYPESFSSDGFINGAFLFFRIADDSRESQPIHPVQWTSGALITELPVKMGALAPGESRQYVGDFGGMMRFLEWAKIVEFRDGVFVRFKAAIHTDDHLKSVPVVAATPWFKLANHRLETVTDDLQRELGESTIPSEQQKPE